MNFVDVLPSITLWIAFCARLSWLLLKAKAGSTRARLLGLVRGTARLHKALFLAALAETLNIDGVYLWLDPKLGGVNVLNLIVHVCLGLGLTELSRSMVRAAGASTRRRKTLFWAGVVMVPAQAILLYASSPRGSAADFTDTFGRQPLAAFYEGLFFAWVAVICIHTCIVLLHRDRSDETRTFSRGMDIVSISCLFACGAAASKLGEVTMAVIGSDTPAAGLVTGAYEVMIGLTCIGFALGLGMPAFEKRRQWILDRQWRSSVSADLRTAISRVSETPLGEKVVRLAGRLPAGSSVDAIYAMVIPLKDIHAYGEDILTASEVRLVDEVEERIAPRGSLRVTPGRRS